MAERCLEGLDWPLARRNDRMRPSAIREVMKLAEKPGVISLAGGFPAREALHVEAVRASAENVLTRYGTKCLQYGPTEGVGELVDWICSEMARRRMQIEPSQVLVTSGSQQGLDLVSRVLAEPGSAVWVEAPTYVGALRAFAFMEPEIMGVDLHSSRTDPQGLEARLGDLCQRSGRPRFMYMLPTYQNPTGRCLVADQRLEITRGLAKLGIPLVEDDPYADLWYEEPPPPPMASSYAEGSIYLGSFSKTIAPGLRLGYLIAPKSVMGKFVQAKQAMDLHTSSFNQYLVADMLGDGFVERHGRTLRELYKARRDALLGALASEFDNTDLLRWSRPNGGMFVWARLREGLDSIEVLTTAVEEGVAYVPGAVFYSQSPDVRTLRLSFVSATESEIRDGVSALARALRRFGSPKECRSERAPT